MKVLRRVVLLLLLGAALLEVGVNVVLATPLAGPLLNLAPEQVQVKFSRASMWVPFHLEVDGLELSIQDPAVQVFVAADHATGTLHPLAALDRHVFITDIVGQGVALRVRERSDEAPDPARAALLPPIPGFPDPRKKVPPDPPIPVALLPLIELSNLTVHDLREVWVDEYHYQGAIEVHGGFALQPLQHLSLEPSTVEIDGGTVEFRAKAPLAVAPSRVEAAVERFPLDAVTPEAFAKLSAHVQLNAHVRSSRWLNRYLVGVPGIEILEGAGALEIDLAIKGGALSPDSHFRVTSPHVVVRLPYVDVSGATIITGDVHQDRPRLHLAISHVRGEQRVDHRVVLNSGQFDLHALGSSTDLTKPFLLDVDLDVRRARAPQLVFLNEYIPDAVGLKVYAGEGTIHGKVALSTRTNHAHGALTIEADSIVLKNRGAMLSGRARVDGVLADLDLQHRHLDFTGSRVSLSNVGVATRGKTYRDFSFELHAEKALFKPQSLWDAKVSLGCSNLLPALGVLSANFELPGILEAFANIPKVRAQGELIVRDHSISLQGLSLDGQGLNARADFELLERGPREASTLAPYGSVLVKVPALSVGLDLQGPKVVPILVGAEEWYTRAVAATEDSQ